MGYCQEDVACLAANVGGKGMYFYHMYGLTIKSTFALPEAVACEPMEKPDVFLELGNPPKEDLADAKAGKICRLEKEVAWFYLKDWGMFYVEHGNHIIVWKESQMLTDLSRNSYVTGTTMGLLMFQREIIPIHCGAVEKNGVCILIVGASGSGKSTTTAGLREKGCRFVSDDVAAVNIVDGNVMVSPSFPQQKLCRDAALRQGYMLKELIYIDENRDKYAVRLKDGYVTKKLPLAMILELQPTDEEKLAICEIRGLDKIKLLYRNIYRGYVWNEMGMSEQVQKNILTIARQVPMYVCKRPKKGFYTEQISEWVLEKVKTLVSEKDFL